MDDTTKTDMPELLPCPFCGGEASRLDGHYDFGGEWFETGCDNVGCPVLPSIKTLSRDHADEAWNTRAALDAQLAEAEAPAREVTVREAAKALLGHSVGPDRHVVFYACDGRVKLYKFNDVLRALAQGGQDNGK